MLKPALELIDDVIIEYDEFDKRSTINTNAKQYEIIGVKYKSSLNPTGINYVFFDDKIFDAKNAMVYKISDVEYKRARIK